MSKTQTNAPIGQLILLPVDSILTPPGANPRSRFDQETLFSLRESLEHNSQLQPIIINQKEGENFLIAGERRLRAAREAGMKHIEAKVYSDLEPATAHRMAMAENRDRVPLNAIEQARSIAWAMELGIGESEIASAERCNVETVRRRVKLLKLPEAVKDMVAREHYPLPIHQALMLLKLPDEQAMLQMARRIAPKVGPVASEDQAKQWIDESLGKPLPFAKPDDDEAERICQVCGEKESKLDGWADREKTVCKNCKANGWKKKGDGGEYVNPKGTARPAQDHALENGRTNSEGKNQISPPAKPTREEKACKKKILAAAELKSVKGTLAITGNIAVDDQTGHIVIMPNPSIAIRIETASPAVMTVPNLAIDLGPIDGGNMQAVLKLLKKHQPGKKPAESESKPKSKKVKKKVARKTTTPEGAAQ